MSSIELWYYCAVYIAASNTATGMHATMQLQKLHNLLVIVVEESFKVFLRDMARLGGAKEATSWRWSKARWSSCTLDYTTALHHWINLAFLLLRNMHALQLNVAAFLLRFYYCIIKVPRSNLHPF